MFLIYVFFYHVQHLERRLYRCFGLVGIEAARSQQFITITPGDDCLNEGVGATSWRNAHRVIIEYRKGAIQILLVYITQGFHEGVILSVARRIGSILAAVDIYFYAGDWFQTVTGAHHVTHELHFVFRRIVFQHV